MQNAWLIKKKAVTLHDFKIKQTRMKRIAYILLLATLTSFVSVSKTEAKKKAVPTMYMFGFAASFNDTIVHFTDVQPIKGTFVDSKTKLLMGRDAYSFQLRSYLADEQQMPRRTCVVVFDKNRNKVEKKYLKMKRLYTQSKDGKQHYDVRYLNINDFKFTAPDVDVEIEGGDDDEEED